jgi:hypothetical protein
VSLPGPQLQARLINIRIVSTACAVVEPRQKALARTI